MFLSMKLSFSFVLEVGRKLLEGRIERRYVFSIHREYKTAHFFDHGEEGGTISLVAEGVHTSALAVAPGKQVVGFKSFDLELKGALGCHFRPEPDLFMQSNIAFDGNNGGVPAWIIGCVGKQAPDCGCIGSNCYTYRGSAVKSRFFCRGLTCLCHTDCGCHDRDDCEKAFQICGFNLDA